MDEPKPETLSAMRRALSSSRFSSRGAALEADRLVAAAVDAERARCITTVDGYLFHDQFEKESCIAALRVAASTTPTDPMCESCGGTRTYRGERCGCGPGVRHCIDCRIPARPCPDCAATPTDAEANLADVQVPRVNPVASPSDRQEFSPKTTETCAHGVPWIHAHCCPVPTIVDVSPDV